MDAEKDPKTMSIVRSKSSHISADELEAGFWNPALFQDRRATLNKIFNDQEYGIMPEQRRSQLSFNCFLFFIETLQMIVLMAILLIARSPENTFLRFGNNFENDVKFWLVV
jgi:hypothetical protein